MLKPIPQTGATDGRVEPSSPPHDRGHDDPEHVAGDTAIRYFGRSPDKLTLDDVHAAFQVHLVSTGISWPGLNQIVCA
jgi:hypothetical protein